MELQRRDCCAQHIDRIRFARKGAQQSYDLSRQLIVFRKRSLEIIEFRSCRQTPVPKEKYDFFKSRLLGQVVNVVALIDQFTLVAVDIRNGGTRRRDSP